MTAVDFYHDALLELERKWQAKEIVTFFQWRDMYINAYKQAKEMEKERMLEFGAKVAMKAHTGKSGWSIIEVYNENK
jgi:hypothetical protein